MRRSIRTRYTLLFAGLLGITILAICLANSLYLERFYINEKVRALTNVYEEVNTIISDGGQSDEKTYQRISGILEESNTSALIDSYAFGFEDRISEQMIALIFGRGDGQAEIITSSDRYVVYYWNDSNMESSFLLCLGFLDNGSACLLRSSVPAIQDSAMISTRFVWRIGILALLLGILIVAFASRRVSEPVKKLSQIADHMAHLDFSVRYQGERDDEIGLLGVSMNRMADALESTVKDLQRANEQLQADIREKEKEEERNREFISNVSHELKTPIALIQGYAEGLMEGITDDPESMAYYCEVIADEADKMNQLVRKLLILNQIESGLNEPEFVDFDLVKMIDGVLHSFNLVFQQDNITVEFDNTRIMMVRADEFMIEEVVRNYISNAVNHTDGERRITIRTEQDSSFARVLVYNTGSPIPEDSIGNVWDKFYKVDKARTREYGGSGIGLSIVKAAMDAHRGRCGVYNTEEGVCFWFELTRPALPAVRTGKKVVDITNTL